MANPVTAGADTHRPIDVSDLGALPHVALSLAKWASGLAETRKLFYYIHPKPKILTHQHGFERKS